MSTTHDNNPTLIDLVRPHVREALRQAGVQERDLDRLADKAAAATRINAGRVEILTPYDFQPLDRISWWVDAHAGRADGGSAGYEDVANAIGAASRRARR